MTTVRLLAACLLIPFGAQGQEARIQLEERSLLNHKLKILMPTGFVLMSEAMLKLKYPSERRPTVVYTNQAGSVNVAVNHTGTRISAERLPELRAQMEMMFKNLYPSAKWFRNEIFTNGGRRYFLFEFQTPAADTEVRNIMLGTSFEGRFLMITFNATKELEKAWLSIGRQIIESVKITAG